MLVFIKLLLVAAVPVLGCWIYVRIKRKGQKQIEKAREKGLKKWTAGGRN